MEDNTLSLSTDISSVGSTQTIPSTFQKNSTGLNNCASGSSLLWPYTTQTYQDYQYQFQIRKVTNGWVLKHNHQEYVFDKAEKMTVFIEKTLTEEKKK